MDDLQNDSWEMLNLASAPAYATVRQAMAILLKDGWKAAMPLAGSSGRSYQARLGIRVGDWVYIDTRPDTQQNYPVSAQGEPKQIRQRLGIPEDDGQPKQLYDLAEDQLQKKNFYSAMPEKAAQLKALLEKYKKDGHSALHSRR